MSADKHTADFLGQFVNMGERPGLRHLSHQRFGIKAPILQRLFQHRADLYHFCAVHNIPDEHIGKHRLHAGRAARQHGKGARGGNGGNGCVTQRFPVFINTLVKQWERSPRFCQLPAGLPPGFRDTGHHLVRQLHGFIGIIGDTQRQKQIGPPHNAQTNFSGGTGGFVNLLQRVFVHVDDVVQKMHGGAHRLFQPVPIDAAILLHFIKIDRSEVAGLIGQQRLLSAGIGGFDLPLGGHHIVPIEPVEKNDARLAVLPGGGDDFIKHRPGVQSPHRFIGTGID